MSYGQPCRRTTTGPPLGPASAYPTLRRPASICFSEPKDLFVPGLIVGTLAGFALPDCATAEPIIANCAAAIAVATVPIKRRRSWLISSDIFYLRLTSVTRNAFVFHPRGNRSISVGAAVYRSERLAPTCQIFPGDGKSDS